MIILLNILFGIVLCYVLYIELKEVLKLTVNKIQKASFLVLTSEHFLAALLFYFLLEYLPNNDVYKTIETIKNSNSWFEAFSLGGKIIAFICYPFIKIGIHDSLLFFLFSLISFKGVTNYLKLIGIKKLSTIGIPIVLLLFIPTFHFWTGYIGKDAITFLLLSYLLIIIRNRKFNWKLILILSVLFIIRPHVAIVVIIALAITILLDKNYSRMYKFRLTFIGLFACSILIPIVLFYFLKIETLTFNAISNYMDEFIAFTQKEANTSVSLVHTSFFERILYLLIMPLPFLYTINSSFLMLVSIENVFYLLVILYLGYSLYKRDLVFNLKSIDIRFAFIASVLLAILFALYLYNLGLGNRMRVLFFPYIFYVIVMSHRLKLPENE